jgi:hypothetical protein
MRNQLQRRLHVLEQQLPANNEPVKALLPEWLVKDLQIQGIDLDHNGRPDLSCTPNSAVHAHRSSSA